MTERRIMYLVLAAGLFLLLGGPSPGAVGGCSEEDDSADAAEFCVERKAWECARARARGEIDAAGEQTCRGRINMQCAGAQWACEVPPSTRQTDACINALSDPSRLNESSASIRECALCNSPVQPTTDGGMGDSGGGDASMPDAARDGSSDARMDAMSDGAADAREGGG